MTIGNERRRTWLRRGLFLSLTALAALALMALASIASFNVTAPFGEDLLLAKQWHLQRLKEKLSHPTEAQFSHQLEETLIRDFFGERKGGVFVDVGANHYKNGSNTYYLEKQLGWSGLAVDALEEFAEGYAKNRPKTVYVTAFVSDTEGKDENLFVPGNGYLEVASSNADFTQRQASAGTSRKVQTATLNQLLARANIQHVDFVNMDIELAEPKALAGFDIERFRPALVCIEAHMEVRQQILDYFAAHRYAVVGKYLRVDGTNLYFRPIDVGDDAGHGQQP